MVNTPTPMPKATVIANCPECGKPVTDLDMNRRLVNQEFHFGDSINMVADVVTEPYITLLPCGHRMDRDGFKIIQPPGYFEGDLYHE